MEIWCWLSQATTPPGQKKRWEELMRAETSRILTLIHLPSFLLPNYSSFVNWCVIQFSPDSNKPQLSWHPLIRGVTFKTSEDILPRLIFVHSSKFTPADPSEDECCHQVPSINSPHCSCRGLDITRRRAVYQERSRQHDRKPHEEFVPANRNMLIWWNAFN